MSDSVPSPYQGEELEAARDAKVVPVAKAVLQDMAENMHTANLTAVSDFTPLLIKILQRTLDADFNLTTENPYLFQLILGAYSAFSTLVQKAKIQPIDNERLGKIGTEMLAIFASADVPMGTAVKQEDQEQALAAVQPQIEALFEREHLTWLEVKYILEGMFNSLKYTEQMFSNNVARSVMTMEAKILGLQEMTDLSMKKLDESLKADLRTK